MGSDRSGFYPTGFLLVNVVLSRLVVGFPG